MPILAIIGFIVVIYLFYILLKVLLIVMGILILLILISVVVSVIIWGTSDGNTIAYPTKPKRTIKPNNSQSVKTRKYTLPENCYYHGTSYENAIEIFNTNLWMIDDPIILGIYMTTDFKTAQEYAHEDGLIMVIYVHPRIELTKSEKNIFVCEIPGAKENFKEYYSINGISPIAILDYNGNRVR